MSDGTEIEIKFALPENRLFELIVQDPELLMLAQNIAPVSRTFEALYFDTPSFALQQNGFAFRLRHEGEDWVATVKSDRQASGGLSEREEWNEKVDGPELSHAPFAGTHVGERIAKIIGREKLQLLFSTRFSRTVIQLNIAEGTEIEMALDRGTIWSGLQGSPINELELELKSGSVSELLKLSAGIAGRWHLLPELKSKFARGLDLLNSNQPGLPDLPRENNRTDTKEPTSTSLINSCVAELFAVQNRTLANNAAPESVRELRIQFRRLRSLIKFCHPTLIKNTGRLHLDRLQQWGLLLGSIRDIDVLITAWEKFALHFSPVYSTSTHWQEGIRERREFLAEDIIHRIRQGEITQLLLELQGWMYLEQEKQSVLEEAEAFGLKVQKSLSQDIKELRDDIRAVDEIIDMKVLHRFRIRAKQLRYIQEAFNYFPRYRDDEFVAGLKKIQSHMGKIQDTCQIKSLFDQFDAGKIDEKFALEKELFICWRSCDTLEYFSTLPQVVAVFRRAAKLRLRTLAAIRTSRRTKTGQNAGAHEPVK